MSSVWVWGASEQASNPRKTMPRPTRPASGMSGSASFHRVRKSRCARAGFRCCSASRERAPSLGVPLESREPSPGFLDAKFQSNYILILRRIAPKTPTSPVPNSKRLEGSGVTVDPVEKSAKRIPLSP
jgi:hypothetical protein